MKRAPAVVVRGLDDARRALAPGLGATLISAPGAAGFAGCGWWRALVASVSAERPGLVRADILDCADAPGRALEAMRIGQRLLVLEACPGRADVAEAAASCGAVLLGARPAALDLGDRRQVAHLASWLAGDTAHRLG
jgi:hypothetical protein